MSTPSTKQYLIRAGITRRYGQHEIYYEISEQIEVSNGQERRNAFQNLQAQLEDQINVYEAVSLPHVKLADQTSNYNASGSTQDTFPLEAIIVENKQGKRMVSAKGGKWAKFGVPIYKGCKTEIDIDKLEYGEHDFSSFGVTACVDLEDGKAKRVRSIA